MIKRRNYKELGGRMLLVINHNNVRLINLPLSRTKCVECENLYRCMRISDVYLRKFIYKSYYESKCKYSINADSLFVVSLIRLTYRNES